MAETHRLLSPANAIEDDLSADEIHCFTLQLEADQFASVSVEQRGVDVRVSVFEPNGNKVQDFDSRWTGPEAVFIVSQDPGPYRLELQSQLKARGSYRLVVKEVRPRRNNDDLWLQAARLGADGKKLINQAKADSFVTAAEKYKTALGLWQQLGSMAGEAQTLHSIGYIYQEQGESLQAIQCYEQSRQLRRQVGDLIGELETLHNLAASHSALGDKRGALRYYRDVLKRRGRHDRVGTAITLNNIGTAYSALGEYDRSLKYLRSALNIWRQVRDDRGLVLTLVGLSSLHIAFGEIREAIQYLHQALAIAERSGDSRGQAHTMLSLGTVYRETGDLSNALFYLQHVPDLMRVAGDRWGQAISLSRFGEVCCLLGETQKSLLLSEEALVIAERLPDPQTKAYVLFNLSSACFEAGQYRRAIEAAERAGALVSETGYIRGQALAFYHTGRAHAVESASSEALECLQESATLFQRIGHREGQANALLELARCELHLGRKQKARMHIEAAIDIIEGVRASVAGEHLRSCYLAAKKSFYELYINILMSLHSDFPSSGYDRLAFETNERALARSLLDVLTNAGAEFAGDVSNEMLRQERSLRRKISFKATEMARRAFESDSPEAQDLKALLNESQRVRAEMSAMSPRYASMTRPVPLSTARIQSELLDMDTTLLAYSLGEDRSFLWRVTPQEVQSEVLPGRSELESLSRSFYERASSRDAGLEEYQHASSVLGRVLLGPVAQHLDSKRVVVIAEGILQYVPFGALSLPGTSEPLLSRLEVVNLPSASCLAAIRQQANARTGAPKSIAIFADPVFEAKDSRVRQTVFAGTLGADRHDRFSRLLFSAVEARGIADTAGDGSLLFALDFDASRERFSRADIGNFRFIHLATHGMLNSVHPELSGIVLSLVDENGNAKDGFLGLQDIYNLKLPAELIVLSACQTALGKEIKGEGLVGLTRGFMYAGASRVVASLWTVDDEVTSALMVEFYKQMFNERVPATAALRRAQLKTRSNPRWQEPYYWAGFVIQGEWR